MSANQNSRLFAASCLALTVTAMTFAIRAGILSELSLSFTLTDTQLGWINSMAFLGFPLATMIGGLICASFLTLVIVPLFYSYLDDLRNLMFRMVGAAASRRQRGEKVAEPAGR